MSTNVETIVNFFESGIKPEGTHGRLGVELEHIITDEAEGPVGYSDEYGSKWLLEQFASDATQQTYGEGGALIGVASPQATLTLEPAAQFEISAGPYEYIGDIRLDFEQIQRHATRLLSEHGHRLVTIGYHPTARVDDLELIPKGRYRHMDAHFQKIGRYGRCMMRGSAATQISIDYYSEQDCMRKMRLASGLAPLFALMCDNSPVFEAEPRPHQLVRTKIWRECDPARCGLVPGIMSPDFSFAKYAEYLLRTPAIFEIDDQGTSHATDKTFAELFESETMTTADAEHVVSLFFNDVRLKTYIEIRPADSMPTPYVCAYAALIKGLFYDADNLDKLDELLDGVDADAVEAAKTELMAHGYDATVYGKPAHELVDALLDMARTSLKAVEKNYLSPLAQLARIRKTLATLSKRS